MGHVQPTFVVNCQKLDAWLEIQTLVLNILQSMSMSYFLIASSKTHATLLGTLKDKTLQIARGLMVPLLIRPKVAVSLCKFKVFVLIVFVNKINYSNNTCKNQCLVWLTDWLNSSMFVLMREGHQMYVLWREDISSYGTSLLPVGKPIKNKQKLRIIYIFGHNKYPRQQTTLVV